MKPIAVFAFAAALALSLIGYHASAQTHSHDHGSANAQPSTSMTVGEVRKIDKEAGKVTIKHGEIKNLDMQPMTMVFRVKEPYMLDSLKPGDRILFRADKVGGQYTVTSLEPAP